MVGYIGDVSKRSAKSTKQALEPCYSYQQDFFSPEELPDKLTIQPKKTRTERQRQFGGVWLGDKLFSRLGLDDFFQEQNSSYTTFFKILIFSRFTCPSSELHIAEHLYEKSAMEDFLGVPAAKVYAQRLYRSLDKLLPCKQDLQKHLKNRLGTLFDIDYDLFLYDVTSTYFEGEHAKSELCKRGYSRDSRPDCKQICIALIVTREGLPLGYEIFPGNTHDSTTVEEIVTTMEDQYGNAKRIWVMDRGMVSEKNLEFLRNNGRRYIIGAPKASLKKAEQNLFTKNWQTVREGVEVKVCPSADNDEEVFILCKSKDRILKEKSMHDRFIKRIENGLEKIKKYCGKAHGEKSQKIAERRIGRLLQQNSRGAGFFDIQTICDKKTGEIKLTIKREDGPSHWKRMTEGHYMLRSNVTDWNAEDLWRAYIHLTDAEEAFKINKHDLHLRPIWHQNDDRIKAHVFVCFITFVMWQTFGLMCKKAGLGDEPRKVLEEIKKICMVDVVLTTSVGTELKIRTVPRPEKPLQILLHRLGLYPKNSVKPLKVSNLG
ncbi:MAG: IS1634 family transposase [Planctomycetota bacterium]